MDVYILLGCSTESELYNRMGTTLQLLPLSPHILILSGTEREVEIMYNHLHPRLNSSIIVQEINSKNTIDNIYNSFFLLFEGKLKIPLIDESGHLEDTEIFAYGKFSIISSEYHINRIKYICSCLDITKNLKISYIPSKTENLELLQSRLKNEALISKNKHIYNNLISRKNKENNRK